MIKIVFLSPEPVRFVGTDSNGDTTMSEILNSGKNLLVFSASAGSGKTYTLVREFLRLALGTENPNYFRRILAITFTRKAADEMKERVILHLKMLSAGKNDTLFDQKFLKAYSEELMIPEEVLRIRAERTLKSILHNYADLSISTIDRFLHRIIRTFARDLKLSSDFEIWMEKDDMLEEAIDRLISEVGSSGELTRVLVDFVQSKTEEGKSWDIRKPLYEFSKIIFREDSRVPMEAMKEFTLEDFAKIRKQAAEYLAIQRKVILDCASEAIELSEGVGLTIDDYSSKKTGPFSIFYKLKAQEGKIEQVNIGPQFLNVVQKDAWIKKDDKQNRNIFAPIQAPIAELQNRVAEFLADKNYFLIAELHHQLFNLSLLHEINTRLNLLKEEKNALFIDDFNRLISDLVLHEPAPFIYERIGELYSHIMIDEFQDTSVLQWQNFIPLVENSLARGLRCLLVGDGKQAIYRFRNGEVEQIAALPEFYGHNDNEILLEKQFLFNEEFLSLQLKTNYRSQSAIVNFNNRFFEKSAIYFQNHLSAIYSDQEQQHLEDKTGGYVECTFVQDDDATKAESFLERALNYVHQCRNDGFALSDITFLVRKNKEGQQVAEYLMKNGFSVLSHDSLLLESSPAVRLLSALFFWLQHPNNEENKGKIIELYLGIKNQSETVLASVESCRLNKHISIETFFRKQGCILYSDQLLRLPIYQLAETITETTGCDKRDSFVNGFLETVYAFSSRSTDLHAFNLWWSEYGKNKPVQMPNGADAVTVMTIHKSKGLQFPVVIMPFVNWKEKKGKDEIWVNLDSAPFGLKNALFGTSEARFQRIGREELFEDEKTKTRLDHINLMYVAFTRAEERMYLISDQQKGGRVSKFMQECMPENMETSDEGRTFFSGVKSKYASKKNQLINEKELELVFSSQWQERIRISYEAQKAWAETDAYYSARFGNYVHYALSQLENKDQIREVIAKMMEEWPELETDVELLRKELTTIFSSPFIQDIYSSGDISKSEMGIIDSKGNAFRPDRIIFRTDKTIVVDFKTGAEKEFHHDQIRRYGELLEEMSYPCVQKFLFYTSTNKTIEVN